MNTTTDDDYQEWDDTIIEVDYLNVTIFALILSATVFCISYGICRNMRKRKVVHKHFTITQYAPEKSCTNYGTSSRVPSRIPSAPLPTVDEETKTCIEAQVVSDNSTESRPLLTPEAAAAPVAVVQPQTPTYTSWGSSYYPSFYTNSQSTNYYDSYYDNYNSSRGGNTVVNVYEDNTYINNQKHKEHKKEHKDPPKKPEKTKEGNGLSSLFTHQKKTHHVEKHHHEKKPSAPPPTPKPTPKPAPKSSSSKNHGLFTHTKVTHHTQQHHHNHHNSSNDTSSHHSSHHH